MDLSRDAVLLVLQKARLSIDQSRGLGIAPGRLSVPVDLRTELTAVFGRLVRTAQGGSIVRLGRYSIQFLCCDAEWFVLQHSHQGHCINCFLVSPF